MNVQARVSTVVKVGKVVKWSRIFVRIFHNFCAIPIMNPLTRVHDKPAGNIVSSAVMITMLEIASSRSSNWSSSKYVNLKLNSYV